MTHSPDAAPTDSRTPAETQRLLEEAEESGFDVEFEMFALGRTPEQVIASHLADDGFGLPPSPSPHADSVRSRPGITWESTREEVLAAVEEHERRAAETRALMDQLVFPGLDEDNPEPGCYWSSDGTAKIHVGRVERDRDSHLTRQDAAGEEDQDDGTWAIG
jgi:hypothetical protein